MEVIISIAAGSIGGAIITWLARTWISERLKQSIQHEYAQKLEVHKAELKSSIQAKDFQYQLYQLRTSLFFDHQREAFASILSQIAETMKNWWDTAQYPDEGLTEPVPFEEYEKVKKIFYDKQLFLDSDCIFAMTLAIEAMSDSFPYNDGEKEHYRDVREPYDRLEFIQDRLAKIFQEKIGLGAANVAKTEIALLYAIRLLNRYDFRINNPIKDSALELNHSDTAGDAVYKAKNNKMELIEKLKELKDYFGKNGFLHEYETKTKTCLKILEEGMD